MNVLTMPGKRLFLTGDEAVARAALEAGVEVATGYPGNPSTKAITALIPIAQRYGIAVEWKWRAGARMNVQVRVLVQTL